MRTTHNSWYEITYQISDSNDHRLYMCSLWLRLHELTSSHISSWSSCSMHLLLCCCQGQMVARGTYSELQGSGLDFFSLLREEEGQEEERQSTTSIPGIVSHCLHTLSDNSMSSMSSLASSRYSLIEGAEPLTMVGVLRLLCFLIRPLEGRRYSPFPCCSLQPDLKWCWMTGIETSLSRQVVQPAEEERRSKGNVSLCMYVTYFRAGANFLVLLVLLLLNALAHVSSFLQLMRRFFHFQKIQKVDCHTEINHIMIFTCLLCAVDF